jgi:hypothetical protein
MTLHVVTITPNHILSVSDRLISTSGGLIELDDDRFKHVTLQTDDARAVISFAGFAGILGRDRKVKETTADWLTGVLENTMKAGYHGIDRHLNDIRDRTNQYLSSLRKKLPSGDLRLAIIVSGWAGSDAFNCVMDNCVEPGMKWSMHARDSLTVRIRKYAEDKFPAGCYVIFLCNELIAKKQTDLRRLLQLKAIQGDVEGMFDASVQIIRATSADPESKGTIGKKCSGICISRNTPGFTPFHNRVDPKIWTVMPNHVTSTTLLKLVYSNDEVHRPKEATELAYLVTPISADTPRKRLAYWHRVRERFRLLHNKYGAKARSWNLKYTLDRFHEWQRNQYEPVNKAVSNEINQAKVHMIIEDPDTYAAGANVDTSLTLDAKFQMRAEGSYTDIWGPNLLDDPFLKLKMEDRFDTSWDKEIDLSDLPSFECEEYDSKELSPDYLDPLFVSMNEGLQCQREGNNLLEEAKRNLSSLIRNFKTYNERFDDLITKFMLLDCPEKYSKYRDYLLDFLTFTQASTYFCAFFIKAGALGLVNEAEYFNTKSIDFHNKAGKALDLLEKELKRLVEKTRG